MLPTRVCPKCEQQLTNASNAIRRHASVMIQAIDLARTSASITDEQRQEFTTLLVATFDNAQSAWDRYREHLIEHGLLQQFAHQRISRNLTGNPAG